MRTKIAIGFLAAALLGLASAAVAAPVDLAQCAKQTGALATPVPKLRLAECRFWQCRCRDVCIRYQGRQCLETIQSCDVCSKCD